jgi:3-phosphoshikimate 1-carboxyvinyltransferase
MTIVAVDPSPVAGSVVAPPSKSYTHRALVAAFLAEEGSTVLDPLESDDTLATRQGIEALGRQVRLAPGRWTVEPVGGRPRRDGPIRVWCGQSGTTLRFLAALAATMERPVVLDGDRALAVRPLGPLLGVLEEAGALVQRAPGGRSLPLAIRGPLHPVEAELDVSESSQYLSGLLLVLPTLPGDSHLVLRGPLVSEPYIEATLDTMAEAGVHAEFDGREARIPGHQEYRARTLQVPGDASSAAYLWAAGAVAGGPVRVRGVSPDHPQADVALLRILDSMGATVSREPDGATVSGGALEGLEVDLTSCPDLYPLVGALAAVAAGPSRLAGAPHVVLKESDRRRATVDLARSLGASARPHGPAVEIEGAVRRRAVRLRGCDDHRIVMSAAVGALAGPGPSTLGDADAVSKSYPGFWDDLRTLGVRLRKVRR